MEVASPFLWSGNERLTPEQVQRKRKVAEALARQGTDASPIQHWAQGAARVAQAMLGGYEERKAGEAEKANAAEDSGLLSGLLAGATGVPATVAAPSAAPSSPSAAGPVAAPNVSPDIKTGIVQTAQAIGADPVDLATAISYETGGTFDPTKAGPRTQWGQHRGLIQFGEPQAKQHGVDWSNPVGSQLGPNGAVASYLKSSGFKPGMNFLDLYSTINAGAPGLYNRSDAKNGGAPGTVRDKVEQQMQGHRAKAQALLSAQAQADMPAPDAMQAEAPIAPAGFAVPPGEPAAPGMTAETFAQIQGGQPLEPVFQSEGASQPWMGTAIPPQQPAMVAQAAPTTLPPPRPADLPAPGAVEASGQMPPQAAPQPQMMPDLSNSPDGGMRALQVQAEQARQSQPQAPQEPMSPLARVASAMGGASPQAAPAAPQSPAVAAVAQAVAQNPGDPLVKALTSPYASEATKKVAMAMLVKKIEGENKAPIAVGKDQRLVDRNGRVILDRDRNASDVKRSLAPVYGTDEAGNTVLLQPSEDGTAPAMKLPPGVKVANGIDKIDTGTEIIIQDKRTGQILSRQPKDIAGAERAKVEGKAAGEAKIDMPGAIAKAEESLATIDAIRNHPGRNQFGATGWGSQLPIIGDGAPGTRGRDFVGLVEQMKGKAFLEAFGQLKGGGAISEGEGAKATAAIARLDRAQSKEGFDAALKDLEDVIRAGIDRAKAKGGVSGSVAQPKAVDTSKPGSFKFNPATGKMEPM